MENSPDTDAHSSETFAMSSASQVPSDAPPEYSQVIKDTDDTSSRVRKRGFLTKEKRNSGQNSSSSRSYLEGSEDEADQHHHPYRYERDGDWGVGDDIKMGLG